MTLPSGCLAIILGVCVTFASQPLQSEQDKEKLDRAIVLMRKAVDEAEKGNYVLGSPFEVCPGKPDPIEFVTDVCTHPSFSCRCF